jgi:hypothetical protein
MIQYGEWKINADITATRELYSSFEMPKDKFAKNFRAYCDMLSAEEREFFDNFGIDPKCAKVKSLGMRNGKMVPTSGYYYICGDFVSTPHQPTVTIEELIENGLVAFTKDHSIHIGAFRFEFQLSSNPNSDIPDDMPEGCICLRFWCDTLPWLLAEKCDKKVKAASGFDRFLSRFARKNVSKHSEVAYGEMFCKSTYATATSF